MKNKKRSFSEKEKRELSDFLYEMTKRNEIIIRKMLEESGVDTSKIKIVDRAKYLVQYFPDVIEELAAKYGDVLTVIENEEIQKEAMDIIQKKFLDELSKMPVKSWNIYYFLRHCKLLEPIVLAENFKIIPFNGWPCKDYLDVVDRIFYTLGPAASSLSEKKFKNGKEYIEKNYSKMIPLSLLMFKDIRASDINEVYQKTAHQLDNIILILI